MDQAASPPQHVALRHGQSGARLEFAVAFVIGVAALSAAISRGGEESYVVSLTNIDTTIVVSLPKFDLPVRHYAAIASMDDAAAPRAAVQMSTNVVHETVAEPSAANIAARALATVIGIASTYNPFRAKPDADAALTASGEAYDPDSWTAAIQIDLRNDFGGVRYGRFYRPTFALLERGDKRAIVRINDVGPLRPGRVIDLNERSMRHFDPSLRLGLVPDMKITLLSGDDWAPGPIEAGIRFGLASAQ